jgi:crotonobetainyl-CoA:carnitine CoA-transferase CaiB-like acyl-CoA transferase
VSAGAFEGIKVLDAASLVAGPMIATYMAEYGADVIKVEMPGTGDPIRQWGANKDDVNLMWKSLGRNKRTVSLNLREPAAQELFRRLAAEVDVVIVNTRPSTLERWGLTWEDLSALNEKLIMIHVTGYGSTGPNSDKPGFGTIMEAMSGFAHITGEADGPPTLPGFMLADCTAAVHGAFAVSAALLHRERTGEGNSLTSACWNRSPASPNRPPWSTTSWARSPAALATSGPSASRATPTRLQTGAGSHCPAARSPLH